MASEDYTGLTVPEETTRMIDEIREIDTSYRSRSEVVRQAVRKLHKEVRV